MVVKSLRREHGGHRKARRVAGFCPSHPNVIRLNGPVISKFIR